MNYIELEQSVHSAMPVELYQIYSDAFTTPYYYTSADENITYNSNTYIALENLKRSQPELTKETSAQTLSIALPRNNELAKRWLSYVPPRTVWITIHRYHRSEAGTPEVVVFWQGKVRGVTWSGNEAFLECMPIDSAFSRNGLRVTYGGTCRHQLYGSKCAVPIALFSKNITVTGVNGNKIQSPDLVTVTDGVTPAPDGWWVSGFVQASDLQVRYITNHIGTEIELLLAIEGLQAGDTLLAAAGCDHRPTTCGIKYDNIVNFGGLGLYVPSENPFTINLNGN